MNLALRSTLNHLDPIVEKDDVRGFLGFWRGNCVGARLGSLIIPEALDMMIMKDAVRCAKVVLDGQAPELCGCRGGPNCMNQYGSFPLHRAAEFFNVDIIKLLFRHGASANLRTDGDMVIKGLLPLHVAVDNTCMHKYLEDGLCPDQEYWDYSEADSNYIFKLIHLLCLPEMKIFLDTTRLIAKYTGNLVDELWNYIKEGKLAQTAVLLLAAQEQIRMGTPAKIHGKSKTDGFAIILDRILDKQITLQSEKGQEVEAKIKLNNMTMMLVHVISKAGEGLDSYIRKHPEVPYFMQEPHLEVLECVSAILKDSGFCPTPECINIGDLCPYDDVLHIDDIPRKRGENAVVTREALEMDYLRTVPKSARKRRPRRWEHKFARRSFFPGWRSVLSDNFHVQIFPRKWRQKATATGSTAPPSVMGTIPQVACNHQPKMLFGTAVNYQSRRLFGIAVNHKPGNLFGTAVNYQPRSLFGRAAVMLLRVLKNT